MVHAALVTVKIDAGKIDEARQVLETQVVPTVSQSTGFVSGVWLEPQADKGFGVVIFTTEEDARAAVPPVGSRPPGAPVTVESVEILPVIASA
jgi:quinol monooxygenase YgiN